jgi:hypothetical protein
MNRDFYNASQGIHRSGEHFEEFREFGDSGESAREADNERSKDCVKNLLSHIVRLSGSLHTFINHEA